MLTSRGKTLRAACHRLPSLSNRLTVIELTVMVGVMIIIALGTSSMFNAGFTTLKHLRMGTDVQSVEQLVSLTLTRPPLSNSPNERVCRTGLNGVSAYTGEKLPNVDIKDAGGRSVLQSLNDKQYTVTAYIDKAI